MKIIVNTRLVVEKFTGIQNYIESLYGEILRIDKKNSYKFVQSSPNKKIGDTEIIKTPRGTFFNALFDCFLMNRILRKNNNRNIIFHGTSFVLPFYKLKNVKYVLTIYDLNFKVLPQKYFTFFNFYYGIFLKRSLINADKIIAISECTKRDIINFYNVPADKIIVTYLAGNVFFDVCDKKVERIYGEKYFLAVTTHPIRKNTMSVIKALAKSNILRKYKFVITGSISHEQKQEIFRLAKKLKVHNNIRLMGHVSREDLLSLYNHAEFFVYPSFYEGFGLPVLEAMMAKCPVIVSNVSCLPEVVIKNYQYLVDPYSIDDIRKKMEDMAMLPRSERKKLVLKNYVFSKNFSWEKCAKKTISIFKSLENK